MLLFIRSITLAISRAGGLIAGLLPALCLSVLFLSLFSFFETESSMQLSKLPPLLMLFFIFSVSATLQMNFNFHYLQDKNATFNKADLFCWPSFATTNFFQFLKTLFLSSFLIVPSVLINYAANLHSVVLEMEAQRLEDHVASILHTKLLLKLSSVIEYILFTIALLIILWVFSYTHRTSIQCVARANNLRLSHASALEITHSSSWEILTCSLLSTLTAMAFANIVFIGLSNESFFPPSIIATISVCTFYLIASHLYNCQWVCTYKLCTKNFFMPKLSS